MRKWQRKFILLLTVFLSGYFITTTYLTTPTIHSKAAILIDASSGKVLYKKDETTSFPVASMSKMMTEYIVLEHIKNGVIGWEDQVTMSELANDLEANAAKITVATGDTLSVRDLYTAMIISSANNATIALAEYISGTEDAFAKLMNAKAGKMGLSDQTQFVNATGLPVSTMGNAQNKMSAKDVAMLAYYLIKDYPEVVETTSYSEYHNDSGSIHLYNTNKMLNKDNKKIYFKGVDGLKTGFTDAAGYCFTGTALQGEKRLISVVINAEDDETRFIETKKLLSFGFDKPYIPSFKEMMNLFIK